MKMITKQELSQAAFNAFLAKGGNVRRIPAGEGRLSPAKRAKLEMMEGVMAHVTLPGGQAFDTEASVEAALAATDAEDDGEGDQPAK